MNVVYYVDKWTDEYRAMLEMSVNSVRKHISFPHIVLQAPEELVHRLRYHKYPYIHKYMITDNRPHWPYWYHRIVMNSKMKNTQCLFLDIDTLILKDISDTFRRFHEIDFLATTRWPRDTNLPQFNWGVYFGQDDELWTRFMEEIKPTEKEPERKLTEIYLSEMKYKERYMWLPGESYNRQCNSRDEKITDVTKILHFKGPRKEFMGYYYNKLILGKEVDKDIDEHVKNLQQANDVDNSTVIIHK